ncbi:MAG: class I SAM-dependent methyltransferase [Candidatus Nanoarchaeia archaeon]
MGYYDEIAPGYEELHRDEQEGKLRVILGNLPFELTSDMKLLDIGCGSGISMEPWDCEKVGIDPSPGLLEIAKKKGLNVKSGKPDELDFADGAFDIVTSITALHHIDYGDDIAKEFARVCKKWLIISYLKKAPVIPREVLLDAISEYFEKVKVLEHDKDVIYMFKRK